MNIIANNLLAPFNLPKTFCGLKGWELAIGIGALPAILTMWYGYYAWTTDSLYPGRSSQKAESKSEDQE